MLAEVQLISTVTETVTEFDNRSAAAAGLRTAGTSRLKARLERVSPSIDTSRLR